MGVGREGEGREGRSTWAPPPLETSSGSAPWAEVIIVDNTE